MASDVEWEWDVDGGRRPAVMLSSQLFAVTALHAAIAVTMTLYPFLVTTNAYDGFYLIAALAVVMQWALLGGECFLSYFEKRLCYGDCYHRCGLAPFHQWWHDGMTDEAVGGARATFAIAIVASAVAVAVRNTTRMDSGTPCGARIAVRFGPTWSIAIAVSIGELTYNRLRESTTWP